MEIRKTIVVLPEPSDGSMPEGKKVYGRMEVLRTKRRKKEKDLTAIGCSETRDGKENKLSHASSYKIFTRKDDPPSSKETIHGDTLHTANLVACSADKYTCVTPK